MESMNDILSDKPAEREPAEKPEKSEKPEKPAAAAEAPEKPEKPEIERPTSRRREHQKRELEAQGRDPETGQFVKKDEAVDAKAAEKPAEKQPEKTEAKAPPKSAEPAKQDMTDKERAAFAALADERRKRQAYEQELAALKARAQPEKPAQPAEAPKSFWDDPEGWKKRFDAEQQTLDAQRRREAISIRLNTSETIARSRYTDFDEKIGKFGELVAVTPGLAQQWLAAPDPAEFAYKTGKNHLELAQAGSLDKLKAEIESKARAEERAKVEAEYKAKEEEAARKRAELPGTLSDVRGAASRQNMPVFGGPTPMADILKH